MYGKAIQPELAASNLQPQENVETSRNLQLWQSLELDFGVVFVDQAIECQATRGFPAARLLLYSQPCVYLARRPTGARVVLRNPRPCARDLFVVKKACLPPPEFE